MAGPGPSARLAMEGVIGWRVPLSNITGVAVDSRGQVFFGTKENIYRIAEDGTLDMVAGAPLGMARDGVGSTTALVDSPALAVDGAGNTYYLNFDSLRRISTDGRVTTVAAAPPRGTDPISGYFGPRAIAIDRNNAVLFRLRDLYRWAEGSNTVSVRPRGDTGIAFDRANNLYEVSHGGGVVYQITPDGKATIFAGILGAGFTGDGGPATAARLSGPTGVATDGAGNVYIADTGNNRIRKVDVKGMITTVAGGGFGGDYGLATDSQLHEPQWVAAGLHGEFYFSDSIGVLRLVDAEGYIRPIAGTGPGGESRVLPPSKLATENYVKDIAISPAGDRYVSNPLIFKLEKDLTLTPIAGDGTHTDPGSGGTALGSSLQGSLAFDSKGNIYVRDFYNRKIFRIQPDGSYVHIAGSGADSSSGDGGDARLAGIGPLGPIAVDAEGNVYLYDSPYVRKITTDGKIRTVAGNRKPQTGEEIAMATLPPGSSTGAVTSLAVDPAGRLHISSWVTDSSGKVYRLESDGSLTTVAGSGTYYRQTPTVATQLNLSGYATIAFDKQGYLYRSEFVIDDGPDRIYKIAPNGSFEILARHYGVAPLLSGDGLPADQSEVTPSNVAVDDDGNVYFVERDFFDTRSSLRVIPVRGTEMTIETQTLQLNPSDSRRVIAVGSTSPVPFSVQVTMQDDDLWLTVNQKVGVLPAQLEISARTETLPPGKYRGTVLVTAPAAQPITRSIAVELTIP